MNSCSLDCGEIPVSVNVSHFQGSSGVGEYHLVVCPTEYRNIETQLEWVSGAYRKALGLLGLEMRTALLRRFFCSDLPNQAAALDACSLSSPRNTDEPCSVSWVGQPPLPPAKATLWAYHVNDPNGALNKTIETNSLTWKRGDLSHHWSAGITCPAGDASYDQTQGVFKKYEAFLQARGMSLAENVIRTWLFVRDIDVNYQGLVVARREFFAGGGLTSETHFIASSGIEATHADNSTKVVLDAYAISGLHPRQVEFLAAPDYLSPTQFYGVTFERGTTVAFRDRKHIILSGTASIDRQGNILHLGDVSRQLDRAIQNIGALLRQAGATLKDMCLFIVYVRDSSDQALARQQMRERFGDVPFAVVRAPVCRPGWLIEVEGIAIVPASNPELPAF